MNFRIKVIALLTCTSMTASASEALIYGSVYGCNAAEITEAMSRICATKVPELATRSSNAFAKWLFRNSVNARAASTSCELEMQKLAEESVNSEKVSELRGTIARLKGEILSDFEQRVATKGAAVCEDALLQLETGSRGVDLK